MFSTFDCVGFGYDDANGTAHSFLRTDLSIMCKGGDYSSLTSLALLLWFLTIFPACIALFCKKEMIRRGDFYWLFSAYRPELWYWEGLETVRKICLTSFLLLISKPIARQFLAVMILIAYFVLLLVVDPYRNRMTKLLQIYGNGVLLCVLLMFMLGRLFNELSTARVERLVGEPLGSEMLTILLAFVATSSLILICLIFAYMTSEIDTQSRRLLRSRATRVQVDVPSLHTGEHLY